MLILSRQKYLKSENEYETVKDGELLFLQTCSKRNYKKQLQKVLKK